MLPGYFRWRTCRPAGVTSDRRCRPAVCCRWLPQRRSAARAGPELGDGIMSVRKIALFLVDNPLVRWLTLLILAVFGLIDRLFSRLRFLALVPKAGRTAW